MVDLADKLNGWTQSVYKFGCAFIHLSLFHSYASHNPFESISVEELYSVKSHLNKYHNFPMDYDVTMNTVSPYLPMVFDKIAGNLEWYIQKLEIKNEIVVNDL